MSWSSISGRALVVLLVQLPYRVQQAGVLLCDNGAQHVGARSVADAVASLVVACPDLFRVAD